VETKIVRFGDKDRHQIYLEPESTEYDWIYCNGLATSVPQDVQEAMVHSIEGLERAQIVQYGYAIEYDFVPPDQLGSDLQAKTIPGLFFAGQINGTSGYEEAAGQGLMAGVNAVKYLRTQDPVVLGRDQAYIGVMIDDLVLKGVDEPYRMFTSRAEFRLLLRADTAERRLCPIARDAGILDDQRWARYTEWQNQHASLMAWYTTHAVEGIPVDQWLRRTENNLRKLESLVGKEPFHAFDPRVLHQAQTDIKYVGYQQRELRAADKLRQLDAVRLPRDLDYAAVPGLKRESRERLTDLKPANLGQASRIRGITPADIMVVMIFLNQRHRP